MTGAKNRDSKVKYCGLDLGTNTTVVLIMNEDRKPVAIENPVLNSVVGYPKTGLIPGVLPHDGPHFGAEALRHQLYLKLKWPFDGIKRLREQGLDLAAARDFVSHLRTLADDSGDCELRVLIGIPADSTPDLMRSLREAVAGTFQKVLMVPEPFLAAVGSRDEAKIGTPGYRDPVQNSLFIDIGAGTTDICRVQGYYPGADDCVSIHLGGNSVDERIGKGIRDKYPDAKFSPEQITVLKEQHSFVHGAEKKATVTHMVKGRKHTLDITDVIRTHCEWLLDEAIKGARKLIETTSADSVEDLLQNIILTGGGSQIPGSEEYVEGKFKAEGFVAKVRKAKDYKTVVARGALAMAVRVKDEQWSIPIG